jgi:hypothetical protein
MVDRAVAAQVTVEVLREGVETPQAHHLLKVITAGLALHLHQTSGQVEVVELLRQAGMALLPLQALEVLELHLQ